MCSTEKSNARSWALTSAVKEIDSKLKENTDEFELNCQKVWKQSEESGVGSNHMEMQAIGSCSLDGSFLGTRIDYFAEFDMDEAGTEREICWCSGVIQEICDGTWQIQGKRRGQCHKENEAAKVFWDAIPDAEMLGW